MTARHKTWARIVGLLAGCALSVAFVLSGALPRVEKRFGATVELVLGSSGELVVTPPGTILTARELFPGSEGRGGRGRLSLLNPTEVVLKVRPVVAPAPGDLSRFVRVSIRADDRKLFDGPLSELRDGSARSLRLPPKGRQRLSFAAGLASSLRPEQYEAQTLESRLQLLTEIEKP